jgi:hypothetical protein
MLTFPSKHSNTSLRKRNIHTFHNDSTAGHSGRAIWGVGLGWLVAGIVGSNPAQGMDVCPRLSVLCCPVYVEALRWADHSSKESYHMSK